jgi:hypothetical protein
VEDFPVATKHLAAHTGMTTPLRTPNGTEVAKLVGAAIRKVITNLDQLGVR